MTDTESPTSGTPQDPQNAEEYRVLARKYRPSTFNDMIGQDAMIRVLGNAISSGRLAHAFMLTGVRGVGKTTSARIIALGLNCIGPDNDPGYGPTTEPCGVCVHCTSITEDRHVDVLEMDAASRTGVDDIRELIEGVRYRPTSARYKVYIIDEVHMLSKNAFNALLKTLEEPPEHVKFIFATTEIRKVPVTVLSRCQRFDLRRVEVGELSDHFTRIAGEEGAEISETAIRLIARAADGSVRDGLSLLDQAISHTDQVIGEDDVRDMLGLADRSQSFDTFEAALKGDAAGALDIFTKQYEAGADPSQVIEDLLEITHWITRIKVSPEMVNEATVPEMERVRGTELSAGLGMAAISRAWQMLLKGLSEVRIAPSAVQAAEMVLIRLAHAASLPSPEEALKGMIPSQGGMPSSGGSGSTSGGGNAGGGSNTSAMASSTNPASPATGDGGDNGGGVRAALRVVNGGSVSNPPPQYEEFEPEIAAATLFNNLTELATYAGKCREISLQAFLYNNVHLIKFSQGRIELNGGEYADAATIQKLRKFLLDETGDAWVITVSTSPGDPTLSQQFDAAQKALKDQMREHPLVKSVVDAFPGAEVSTVEDHPPFDGDDT